MTGRLRMARAAFNLDIPPLPKGWRWTRVRVMRAGTVFVAENADRRASVFIRGLQGIPTAAVRRRLITLSVLRSIATPSAVNPSPARI